MIYTAPRQGLFAIIIASSLCLHTVFLVISTEQQITNSREQKGERLVQQLVDEASLAIAYDDRVSLSVLASRYTSEYDVTALVVKDVNGVILTKMVDVPDADEQGIVIEERAVRNNNIIGKVELTMQATNKGEIFKRLWLFILGSTMIHGFIWLLYDRIARPTKEQLKMLSKEIHEHFFAHYNDYDFESRYAGFEGKSGKLSAERLLADKQKNSKLAEKSNQSTQPNNQSNTQAQESNPNDVYRRPHLIQTNQSTQPKTSDKTHTNISQVKAGKVPASKTQGLKADTSKINSKVVQQAEGLQVKQTQKNNKTVNPDTQSATTNTTHENPIEAPVSDSVNASSSQTTHNQVNTSASPLTANTDKPTLKSVLNKLPTPIINQRKNNPENLDANQADNGINQPIVEQGQSADSTNRKSVKKQDTSPIPKVILNPLSNLPLMRNKTNKETQAQSHNPNIKTNNASDTKDSVVEELSRFKKKPTDTTPVTESVNINTSVNDVDISTTVNSFTGDIDANASEADNFSQQQNFSQSTGIVKSSQYKKFQKPQGQVSKFFNTLGEKFDNFANTVSQSINESFKKPSTQPQAIEHQSSQVTYTEEPTQITNLSGNQVADSTTQATTQLNQSISQPDTNIAINTDENIKTQDATPFVVDINSQLNKQISEMSVTKPIMSQETPQTKSTQTLDEQMQALTNVATDPVSQPTDSVTVSIPTSEPAVTKTELTSVSPIAGVTNSVINPDVEAMTDTIATPSQSSTLKDRQDINTLSTQVDTDKTMKVRYPLPSYTMDSTEEVASEVSKSINTDKPLKTQTSSLINTDANSLVDGNTISIDTSHINASDSDISNKKDIFTRPFSTDSTESTDTQLEKKTVVTDTHVNKAEITKKKTN